MSDMQADGIFGRKRQSFFQSPYFGLRRPQERMGSDVGGRNGFFGFGISFRIFAVRDQRDLKFGASFENTCDDIAFGAQVAGRVVHKELHSRAVSPDPPMLQPVPGPQIAEFLQMSRFGHAEKEFYIQSV